MPPGTQVARQTVAFRWSPSNRTPVLVHQRADHAVARGARPPPETNRRLAKPSVPFLRRLACEASGFRDGCTCLYLSQPQGCGRSLRYQEDSAAWRIPPGGRRIHAELAFRWHIGSVETIVHLLLHHVLERCARVSDHWAAGVHAASSMRRPARVAVMTPEGAGQPITRRSRSSPERTRRPAAAWARHPELTADQERVARRERFYSSRGYWLPS